MIGRWAVGEVDDRDDGWQTWDWWEPPEIWYVVALILVIAGFLMFYRS